MVHDCSRQARPGIPELSPEVGLQLRIDLVHGELYQGPDRSVVRAYGRRAAVRSNAAQRLAVAQHPARTQHSEQGSPSDAESSSA
jgi:hypothetical protein